MSTGGFGQGHIDPQLDEMKIGENLGSTSQVVQEVVGLKDIQVSHVLVKSIFKLLVWYEYCISMFWIYVTKYFEYEFKYSK